MNDNSEILDKEKIKKQLARELNESFKAYDDWWDLQASSGRGKAQFSGGLKGAGTVGGAAALATAILSRKNKLRNSAIAGLAGTIPGYVGGNLLARHRFDKDNPEVRKDLDLLDEKQKLALNFENKIWNSDYQDVDDVEDFENVSIKDLSPELKKGIKSILREKLKDELRSEMSWS